MAISQASRLYLGCGRRPKEGWINLDKADLPGVDMVFDLEECGKKPLPFEDNSIDEILAVHLIEHIENVLPMMQELHRVARPGARAIFKLPYGSSDDAWENPTHVRPYFYKSFGFFSQPYYWREDYAYRGDWKIERVVLVIGAEKYQGKTMEEISYDVDHLRNVVLEMIAELSAVKPIRKARKELQEKFKVEFALCRS